MSAQCGGLGISDGKLNPDSGYPSLYLIPITLGRVVYGHFLPHEAASCGSKAFYMTAVFRASKLLA